jgi:predicted dithiol-disulfide oxidoreductase (DUF899 family)
MEALLFWADMKVVTREEWLAERRALLAREKQLTREHDAVREMRRALPWVKVEKNYEFEGPKGRESLGELFAGRSQLIVRHFMFGPQATQGCVGCSFASDHVDGALVHLEHRDTTYVAVSRAPFARLDEFRRRMGWKFKWVSCGETDFSYDFQSAFTPEELAQPEQYYNFERRKLPFVAEDLSGISVFAKDGAGDIFHTYSCYARGDEGALGTYFYLDLTPKGRDESPEGNLSNWVRHHDRYD